MGAGLSPSDSVAASGTFLPTWLSSLALTEEPVSFCNSTWHGRLISTEAVPFLKRNEKSGLAGRTEVGEGLGGGTAVGM